MRCSRFGLIPLLSSFLCLGLPAMAQSSSPQPQSAQPATDSNGPAATFRVNSRMVTVELVARDSKGNHITGLKPEDLRLFEQIPSKNKEKHEQKIASLREVHMADLVSEAPPEVQAHPGIYTNGVKRPKEPVPPTILLVDGLNTAAEHQAQVHVQMLKMLRQLPPNVPVAVFLLGGRLTMLQSFTSDPRLLQIALGKAISTAGKGVADIDPADDPDAVGNLMGELGQGERSTHSSRSVATWRAIRGGRTCSGFRQPSQSQSTAPTATTTATTGPGCGRWTAL